MLIDQKSTVYQSHSFTMFHYIIFLMIQQKPVGCYSGDNLSEMVEYKRYLQLRFGAVSFSLDKMTQDMLRKLYWIMYQCLEQIKLYAHSKYQHWCEDS